MGEGKTIPSLRPAPSPNLNWQIALADPVSEEAFYVPLNFLLTLLGLEPVTSFINTAAMLANTTLQRMYFAYVADASSELGAPGQGLFLYLGGDRTQIGNYFLVNQLSGITDLSGAWIHRDDWGGNLSLGLPAVSNIKKFNTFYVTVAGNIDFGNGLGAELVPAGSIIYTVDDAPGSNGTKYRIM